MLFFFFGWSILDCFSSVTYHSQLLGKPDNPFVKTEILILDNAIHGPVRLLHEFSQVIDFWDRILPVGNFPFLELIEISEMRKLF